MSKLALSIFAAAVAASAAMAGSIVTYAEALEAIKKPSNADCDILVFCMGTGWMRDAALIKTAYQRAVSANAGNGIIWAMYDMSADLDEAGRKALGALPVEVYGYPAWIYMDSKLRPIWHEENIAMSDVVKLPATAKALNAKRKRRDAAILKASSLKEIERAAAIGKALAETLDPINDTMVFREANQYRSKYQSFFSMIKSNDPNDRTGYYFKYTFSFLPVMEGTILKNDANKEYDKNYAYTREKLVLNVLSPSQRQQLIVFNYRTALDSGDFDKAMKYLDEAIAVSSSTAMGQDCVRMKQFLTQPVVLTDFRWTPKDNRPRWTPMSLDASGAITKPGEYTVTFRHEAGQTKFRNLVLRVGRETLATAEGEKAEFVLSVKRLPVGRPILTVEGQGTGWFDGCGDIVVTAK
jgi:tetratricopeptide (TPR) repeat protein